jgi:oligopeptide transport system ATP-binding protein
VAEAGHLLDVHDLRVEFRTERGILKAVDGVTYTVDPGEVVAILGESGSGKTVHARAMLGILDTPPAYVTGATVRLEGTDLLTLPPDEMNDVRGERIAMLFQDPHAALDPVFSVGYQLTELLRSRGGYSRREAREKAADLLREVGVASPRERLESYPHQLSGGIAQRVMVAMAIALDPRVLVADEPTSSLDVTVQAQVLELPAGLIRKGRMGLVLITHNLAVAVGLADRIAVMYAGRVVEMGPARDVYEHPVHPTPRDSCVRSPHCSVASTGCGPSGATRRTSCVFHGDAPSIPDAGSRSIGASRTSRSCGPFPRVG